MTYPTEMRTQREMDAELIDRLGEEPDDDGECWCESYDCAGECCGVGNCTCSTLIEGADQ